MTNHNKYDVHIPEEIDLIDQYLSELDVISKHQTLAQKLVNFGTLDWNRQNGMFEYSEMIEQILGQNEGEFAGTYDAFLSHIHPDDKQLVIDAIENSSGNKGYNIDHRSCCIREKFAGSQKRERQRSCHLSVTGEMSKSKLYWFLCRNCMRIICINRYYLTGTHSSFSRVDRIILSCMFSQASF